MELHHASDCFGLIETFAETPADGE